MEFVKAADVIKNFTNEQKFKNIENKTIVVDFDDTVVTSNNSHINGHFKEIRPIVDAINFAKGRGFYVYIVTARHPLGKHLTEENAKSIGLQFDNIFTSVIYGQNSKQEIMESIQKLTPAVISTLDSSIELIIRSTILPVENGSNILLMVGDQWTDLMLPEILGLKLPDSKDRGVYLKINNTREKIY